MSEFQPIEKICRVSGKKFTVYPEDQEFYAKKGVSLPMLCPQERSRRRYGFMNSELSLYRRKCDATGKDLITFYHPATSIKVYDRGYWYGDEFDPMKYGRDYDPSRLFFEQLGELYWTVPTFHSAGVNNENGDYITYGQNNKNSYLMGGFGTENCMYGVYLEGRDCVDNNMVYQCESCYECIQSSNCYELFFGSYCENCRESRFLDDCMDCHDCIMCFGLRHKSYCIKNQQLTKEEYEREKVKYRLGSYQYLEKLKREYEEFLGNYPLRENKNVNCENCVGDFLRNARNCFECFNGSEAKDCRYCIPYSNKQDTCFDTCATGSVDSLECGGGYNFNNSMFSRVSFDCTNIDYCFDIMAQSHDLFGCVRLKGNNEYCILNKQYSKDEYFELRGRIIEAMKKAGEWGEYLPMKWSLFPYYDTYSNYAFPIVGEQIKIIDEAKGLAEVDLGGPEKTIVYWWPQVELESSEVSGYEPADDIQDYAGEDKQKELLNAVLVCDKTGRKYRIQSRELYFYLKHNIAIPRESYYARHPRRIKQMMRFDIHPYKCDKCGKEIKTLYSKETDKREVWCGECYQKTVVG